MLTEVPQYLIWNEFLISTQTLQRDLSWPFLFKCKLVFPEESWRVEESSEGQEQAGGGMLVRTDSPLCS